MELAAGEEVKTITTKEAYCNPVATTRKMDSTAKGAVIGAGVRRNSLLVRKGTSQPSLVV
jgi:hypothetical protein